MYSKDKDALDSQHAVDELQKALLKITELNDRLEKWAIIFARAEIDQLLINYSSPRRILYLNLLAGLARGLGLTIGTTLVLGFLGYLLKDFVSLPVIGEYIADLIDMIDIHRNDFD